MDESERREENDRGLISGNPMFTSTRFPSTCFASRFGQAALLVGLVFLLYAPSLWNGFCLDDGPVLRNDARLISWEGLPLLFRFVPSKPQLPFARLTRKLTLFVEYRIWGCDPFGFHLGNLVYHTLAVLVFWGYGRTATGSAKIAWMAAALFAVHPVVSSSVDSIANRKEILAFLMCCLSLWIWEKNRSAFGWTLSLAAFVLALFSKETAAAACLVFLYRAAQRRAGDPTNRPTRELMRCLPFAILGAGWLAYLHGVTSTVSEGGRELLLFNPQTAPGYPYWTVVRSIPIAWWTYLRQSLFPAEPLLTYEPCRFVAPAFLSLAVGCAAWIVMLLLFRKSPSGSPFRLGVVWYFVFLLPTLNLIPSAYFFAERYLYMPLVGLSWAVCAVLCKARRPVQTWILFAFLLWMSAAETATRHPLWRSNLSYWKIAHRSCPESVEAQLGLGSALIERGLWRAGELFLREGLSHRPHGASVPSALYNLGLAAFERQDRTEASTLWSRALSLDRSHLPSRMAYARWLALENRTDEAISLLEDTLKRIGRAYGPPQRFGLGSEEAAECCQQLGALAIRQGRLQEAHLQYQRAVALQPSLATSWLALGWLYGAGPVPDPERAHQAYQRALEEGGPIGACSFGLARTAEELGRIGEAVRWYETASSSPDLSLYFKETCRKKAQKLSRTDPRS